MDKLQNRSRHFKSVRHRNRVNQRKTTAPHHMISIRYRVRFIQRKRNVSFF